jgi:hypothetical protein
MFRTYPPNVRRGLLRLYFVISAAWIAWFGYQLFVEFTRKPYLQPSNIAQLTWLLVVAPACLPLLFVVVTWILNGFRKADETNEESEPLPDYEALIRRAVGETPFANRRERKAVYRRARTALENNGKHLPARERAARWRKLGLAVRSAEADFAAQERARRKAEKASTALLLFTVFIIPGIWLLDVSSLALYWIARLPVLKRAEGSSTE